MCVSIFSTRPTISSTVRKPRLAMCWRICSAMKKKKLITCSGVPVKRARRTGSCVAMPTGQVFKWHCGKAKFLCAEKGGYDDVAAGLELAVGLHADARAQIVEQQNLLSFGEAELPGQAGVL